MARLRGKKRLAYNTSKRSNQTKLVGWGLAMWLYESLMEKKKKGKTPRRLCGKRGRFRFPTRRSLLWLVKSEKTAGLSREKKV